MSKELPAEIGSANRPSVTVVSQSFITFLDMKMSVLWVIMTVDLCGAVYFYSHSGKHYGKTNMGT